IIVVENSPVDGLKTKFFALNSCEYVPAFNLHHRPRAVRSTLSVVLNGCPALFNDRTVLLERDHANMPAFAQATGCNRHGDVQGPDYRVASLCQRQAGKKYHNAENR